MEANFGLSCRSTIVRRARARKTLTGSGGAKLDPDDDAHPVRRQVRGSMTPSPSSGLTAGTQRHAPDQQSTISTEERDRHATTRPIEGNAAGVGGTPGPCPGG